MALWSNDSFSFKKKLYTFKERQLCNRAKKGLKMRPDLLFFFFFYFYASRNAKFTLPNAPHNFPLPGRSVTHGNVPSNLLFRCFNNSIFKLFFEKQFLLLLRTDIPFDEQQKEFLRKNTFSAK